jgi:hypothetical protein
MNTLNDRETSAKHVDGFIVVSMAGGGTIRFPVAENPRLARGTPLELNHIEISPFGLHWPELDEDLSFRGLKAITASSRGNNVKNTASDDRISARAFYRAITPFPRTTSSTNRSFSMAALDSAKGYRSRNPIPRFREFNTQTSGNH